MSRPHVSGRSRVMLCPHRLRETEAELAALEEAEDPIGPVRGILIGLTVALGLWGYAAFVAYTAARL